jgi:hypothetical protein
MRQGCARRLQKSVDNMLNLVLLILFLAVCVLLVVGYLRVRTAHQLER